MKSVTWKRASVWLVGAGLSLLGTLAYGAAAEVWQAKADHEKRLITLETDGKNNHDLLTEVRQDVKEILRKLP